MDVIAKETRLRHRPLARAGRRRRQRGADGVRRVPGDARRGRAHLGRADAAGRRVAVEGVGKVGSPPGRAPARGRRDGRRLRRQRRPRWSGSRRLGVEVARVDALPTGGLDVYAPCALGASVTDELVPQLQAQVVCGAANNQLAHPGIEKALADRGVLYTPDYVANAGGLVPGRRRGARHGGFRFERAKAKAARHLRHDAGRLPVGRRRRRAAGRRRRPARRAADGRRRPAAQRAAAAPALAGRRRPARGAGRPERCAGCLKV